MSDKHNEQMHQAKGDEDEDRLDSPSQDTRKSIDIPTPFGAPIKIRGYDIIALGFIAYIAFTIYIFWIIKDGTENAHRIIIQQMAEQSFIIHLSETERAALRLPMPDSLRRRVGDEEYYNFLQERYKREVTKELKDRTSPSGVVAPPKPPSRKDLNDREDGKNGG